MKNGKTYNQPLTSKQKEKLLAAISLTSSLHVEAIRLGCNYSDVKSNIQLDCPLCAFSTFMGDNFFTSLGCMHCPWKAIDNIACTQVLTIATKEAKYDASPRWSIRRLKRWYTIIERTPTHV